MRKNNLILPAIILFIICLVTTGLVSMTFELTADARAMQKEISDNLNRRLLFPDALDFEAIELADEQLDAGLIDAFKAMAEDGGELGVLITAQSRGYGGQVPVMVAIDASGEISAIKVLSNDETPGLGQKVADSLFAGQFSGQAAASQFTVDNTEGAIKVDAVTGATISSRAVISAVNAALAFYSTLEMADNAPPVMSHDECRQLLFPQASEFIEVSLTPQQKLLGVVEAHKALDSLGEMLGHAVVARSKGYNDTVAVMVGVDPDNVILDVTVLDHVETDDSIQAIEASGTAEQFAGYSAGNRFDIETNENGQILVDAASGATVSSRAIVRSVNIALDYFMNNLRVIESVNFDDYRELLFPQASVFDDLVLGEQEIEAGLVEAAVAKNETGDVLGYFIVSEKQGYGGLIPIIAAVGRDEVISGLVVLPRQESLARGTQVAEIGFVDQFIGLPASTRFALEGDSGLLIDTAAGATISSQAVVDAMNLALAFFDSYLSQDNMQLLFPRAVQFNTIELDDSQRASGLVEAYSVTGEAEISQGYLVVARAPGHGGDVNALVAIDPQGSISGLIIQATYETQGLGSLVAEDAFSSQFVGLPAETVFSLYEADSGIIPEGIALDAIAGATESSLASVTAVNLALEYYNLNLAEVQ